MTSEQDDSDEPISDYRRILFKVAFTGICGVGKTSLFRRIFKQDFCEGKPPSSKARDRYEEVFRKEETVIELDVWDTADMDRHGSITQSYYRGSHFILLVYSADDEYSLHKLKGIADDVKHYEPASSLILVRNKIDLTFNECGVSPEKETAFVRNLSKKILCKFSTSAKTNQGVENLLKELCKLTLRMSKSGRRQVGNNDVIQLHYEQTDKKSEYHSCCR